MRLRFVIIAMVVLGLVLVSSGKKRFSKKKQRIMHDQEPKKGKIEHVELGERCSYYIGVNPETGSWELTDDETKFVCPKGSSCVWETCNCDNLPDGTIVQNSWDVKTRTQKCKRIVGQKCRSEDDCVYEHRCLRGKCACPEDKKKTCHKEKRLVHEAT